MTPKPINALDITIYNIKHTKIQQYISTQIQTFRKIRKTKNKMPNLCFCYISNFHNLYFVCFIYFVYFIFFVYFICFVYLISWSHDARHRGSSSVDTAFFRPLRGPRNTVTVVVFIVFPLI